MGTVGVFLYREGGDPGQPVESVLTASFAPGPADICTEVQSGACTRKDCSWATQATSDTPIAPHAGRITATSDGRTMVVQPDDSGPYRAHFEPIALWEPGHTVLIEAEGDAVPGFSVEMQGPSNTVIMSPPPPSPTAWLVVDRGDGLLLTWNENESGDMRVFLSYQGDHEYGLISCQFPGTSGGDLIPGELLRDFNPRSTTMRLTMGIGQSTIVERGASAIEVVLYTNAISEVDADASYPVHFRD